MTDSNYVTSKANYPVNLLAFSGGFGLPQKKGGQGRSRFLGHSHRDEWFLVPYFYYISVKCTFGRLFGDVGRLADTRDDASLLLSRSSSFFLLFAVPAGVCDGDNKREEEE